MWMNILMFLFFSTIMGRFNSKSKKRKPKKCLVGKTAVVTGGNEGIGYQIALELAARGCKVVIADVVDATKSVEKIIEESANANISYIPLDLGSLKSVRTFAKNFLSKHEELHFLFNNAGIASPDEEYTEDNILKILQVNYLGHFLLTHLFSDILKKTEQSRLVFMTSSLYVTNQIHSAKDINLPAKLLSSLWPWEYANSNACLLVAAENFAKTLEDYTTKVISINPGLAKTNIFKPSKVTGGLRRWYFKIFGWFASMVDVTTEKCAESVIDIVLSEDLKAGGYYSNGEEAKKLGLIKHKELCREIWEESERLVYLDKSEKLL